MFYQESAPLGPPSATCQSMEPGHPGEAAATDTFFWGGESVPWVKKQFGVKVKN